MSFIETVRLLNLQMSIAQSRACQYLENVGLRFCVDFGYDNAVELAHDHWRLRRKRRSH